MASLKDISKICGVSVATVSKALNDHKDIGEETKANIRRVAKEMGYSPNLSARALKTNRTYGIGVLFVDEAQSGLTHDYFSSVLDSFKRTAEKSGYDITFINHNVGGKPTSYLQHCRYRGVDGVATARTVRIGCPTWNTAGTEALTEWCSPVSISQIPKSSN